VAGPAAGRIFFVVVRKPKAQSGRLFFLKRGSFVIAHTESSRAYIGQVLDMYKLASGNRYGSVKTANTVETLKYLSVRVFLLQSSVILPLSSSTMRLILSFVIMESFHRADYYEGPSSSCITKIEDPWRENDKTVIILVRICIG